MMFMGKDGGLDMELDLSLPTSFEILHSAVPYVATVGSNLDRSSGVSWDLLAEPRGFSSQSCTLYWLKHL